jgi:hypothetical protein
MDAWKAMEEMDAWKAMEEMLFPKFKKKPVKVVKKATKTPKPKKD